MPNTFHGKGNLADAPTIKTVVVNGEDRKVAEMRVMFDEYSYDKDSKEYVQDGGFWLGVSIWDQRGEDVARLLRKGCRVSVDGSLRQFMYTVKGTDIEVPGFQVVADDINLSMGRIEAVTFKAKREAAQ